MATSAAEAGPGLVKLISAEGHEFWVDRKCACISGIRFDTYATGSCGISIA